MEIEILIEVRVSGSLPRLLQQVLFLFGTHIVPTIRTVGNVQSTPARHQFQLSATITLANAQLTAELSAFSLSSLPLNLETTYVENSSL